MRPRDLIPSLVVVACAVFGVITDDDDCPAGTDGPQFACWLEEHPEQLG